MNERAMLQRLPKDGDLIREIRRAADAQNMTRGTVQVIGALKRAEISFYRQKDQTYVPRTLEHDVEILAGMGNISLKDGETFVHLHLTLGDENGTCTGGHAMEGCIIFAAEAMIREISGPPLHREFDEETGLFLWREPN